MLNLIRKYSWLIILVAIVIFVSAKAYKALFPIGRHTVIVETYVANQGKWLQQETLSLKRPYHAYAKFVQGRGFVRMGFHDADEPDFGMRIVMVINSDKPLFRLSRLRKIEDKFDGLSFLPDRYLIVPPSASEIGAIKLEQSVAAEKGKSCLLVTKRGVFKLYVKHAGTSISFEPLPLVFPGLFQKAYYKYVN